MAALGGLVAAAPLVGAQSSAPDRSAHLLVVPDTARADATLERSNARTVARYGGFTLVEARGEDDAALRGAGADRRDDMREVGLPGGSFDPLRGRDSLAGKDAADPNEALAVVQFEGPVKDAWLERLRDSGARIVQYVAQNGYLVHASGEEVDRLAALVGTDPAVRAVTRVTAGDKKSDGPRSGARCAADAGRRGGRGCPPGRRGGGPLGSRGLDGWWAHDAVRLVEWRRHRCPRGGSRRRDDYALFDAAAARRAQRADRGRESGGPDRPGLRGLPGLDDLEGLRRRDRRHHDRRHRHGARQRHHCAALTPTST